MSTEKRLVDANELVRKINKLDVFYFSGETDIYIHDCQMVELGAALALVPSGIVRTFPKYLKFVLSVVQR